MGVFDGCLLACDIDGTLISNDIIPQENVEKIDFFMREGGMFSLATGRTPGAVSAVLEKLGKVSPSVYGNGCMIYDFNEQRFLYEEFISDNAKAFTKEIMDKMPDVGIEIHSGTNVLVVRETQETIDHEKYESIEAKSIDYDDVLVYNWNKVIYMLENKEQLPAIKAIAARYSEYADFVETNAVIGGRMRYYFEQVPKGASKRSGLLRLCELLDIKKGNFFAIGDYFNDLHMLEVADISACPLDSPEEILNAANIRVTKAENGAVADFIDYLTKQRKEA